MSETIEVDFYDNSVNPSVPLETVPTAVQIDTATNIFAEIDGELVRVPIDLVRGNQASVYGGTTLDRIAIFDDFTELSEGSNITTNNVAVTSKYASVLGGTAATILQGAASEFLPGILSLATGTTTTGYCGVRLQNALAAFINTQPMRFGSRLRQINLSDATHQYEVRTGMVDVYNNAAVTNGMFFRAQHGDTNWEAVTVSGGTATVVNTGVPFTTSGYKVFEIYYDGATSVNFYIDGILVATSITNIQALFTTSYFVTAIYKAASTTSRNIYLDAQFVETGFPNRGMGGFCQ